MGAVDVGIFAATIGVVMALVEVIKLMAKKRDGGSDNSIHLLDVARDQLKTLHEIDKEVAGMRTDLRALWTAQNHLDRKVDALHRRFDSQRRTPAEAQ